MTAERVAFVYQPQLSATDREARRWLMDSYDSWFEQRIPDRLMLSKRKADDGCYEIYCAWFEENGTGYWALPRSHLILFTHEEDRVKFILRFL
jgi:hypothetical protein